MCLLDWGSVSLLLCPLWLQLVESKQSYELPIQGLQSCSPTPHTPVAAANMAPVGRPVMHQAAFQQASQPRIMELLSRSSYPNPNPNPYCADDGRGHLCRRYRGSSRLPPRRSCQVNRAPCQVGGAVSQQRRAQQLKCDLSD